MSSQSALDALIRLETDPRFGALVKADRITLGLYFLRLRQRKVELPPRLLYAWVFPSWARTVDWSDWVVVGSKATGIEGMRYSLHGARITDSSERIRNVIRAWITEDLGRASGHVDLQAPLLARGLTLQSNLLIDPYVSFLRTQAVLRDLIAPMRGGTSPDEAIPHWVLSLVLPDTSALFTFDTDPPSRSIEVANAVVDMLARETGLRFRTNDAARLGSLELLSGAYSPGGKSAVKIVGSSAACTVTIRTESLARGTKVLVLIYNDISQDNVGSCFLDTIVEEPGEPIVATLLGEHNGTSVQVWLEVEGCQGAPFLWYEHRITYIDEIGLSMGLVGQTGTVTSPWLKELAAGTKHPAVAQRATKVQNFSRLAHTVSSTISNRSAISRARAEAAAFARSLTVPEHDSRFFSKGWRGEAGPGRLAFFEWLKHMMDSTREARFIFIDPYFDGPGLEPFMRAGHSGTRYIVLTCTQARSDDHEISGPSREDRIRTLAHKNIAGFSGLSFQVLDLRSRHGGSKRLFHDRYIIELNQDDVPGRAFSLSNSLQGATKKEALLVTPIGGQALQDVAKYVAKLLHGDIDPSASADIVEIFSSRRPGHKRQPQSVPDSLQRFFSIVFRDEALEGAKIDALFVVLQSYGIKRNDRQTLVLCDSAWASIFAARARVARADVSGDLFKALVWVLAHTPSSERIIEQLAQNPPDGWLDMIVKSIANTLQSGEFRELVMRESAVGIELGVVRDLNAALDVVVSWFRRTPLSHRTPWALNFGLHLLSLADVERFAALLEEWVSNVSPDEENEIDIRATARGIGHAVNVLIESCYRGSARLELLCSSKMPVLRAVGIWGAIHDESKAHEEVCSIFTMLVDQERMLALALAAGQARHCSRHSTDLSQAAEHFRYFEVLARELPVDTTLADLRRVAELSGGPHEGSHLAEFHNHVLTHFASRCEACETKALRLEIDVFTSRLCGLSPFGSRPAASPRGYFHSVDADVVLLAGCALAKASREDFQLWRDRVLLEVRRWRRVLVRPFSGTIDYSLYSDSWIKLVWLRNCISVAQQMGRDQTDFSWWEEEILGVVELELPDSAPDGLSDLHELLKEAVDKLRAARSGV